MEGVKSQLYADLGRMKFDPKIWNENEKNESVVLGVLAAGLYPNIARIGGDMETMIKKPKVFFFFFCLFFSFLFFFF